MFGLAPAHFGPPHRELRACARDYFLRARKCMCFHMCVCMCVCMWLCGQGVCMSAMCPSRVENGNATNRLVCCTNEAGTNTNGSQWEGGGGGQIMLRSLSLFLPPKAGVASHDAGGLRSNCYRILSATGPTHRKWPSCISFFMRPCACAQKVT